MGREPDEMETWLALPQKHDKPQLPWRLQGPRSILSFEPGAAWYLIFMTLTLSQKAKIKLCFSYSP